MVKSPQSESGKILSEVLRSRGKTQKDLSEALGVTQGYVSNIASGLKTMSPKTADRIAEALELNPQETVALHTAAAKDHGFILTLPEGF